MSGREGRSGKDNDDGGNGRIYNFEQLVGYLIKEKIIPLS